MPGYRKRAGLYQHEVAELIGASASVVTKYEDGSRLPPLLPLIALEVVYGTTARQLYPHLFATIQDQVMRRAAKLDRKLARKTDDESTRKRRHLSRMVERAVSTSHV
jgi:transcriptional regulator with XRE-family HTH domain